MHRARINNTTIFVTVLSACLGLVAAGLPPAQAHQAVSSNFNELAAASCARGSYQHSLSRVLKLTAAAHSPRSLPFAAGRDPKPTEILYQNSEAPAGGTRFLIVTHLARASLDTPAEA
jgi:hypothetical protein